VLLLAFDTATPAVTVAVHDGSAVVARRLAVDARRHGELLAAQIAGALADCGATGADLTAIAVGTGPGPYTGLRVGLVTARVLASVLDIPLYGVCTLDVIAREAAAGAAGREFLVATDARRKEVYWARYSAAGDRICGPAVSAPAELPPGGPIAGEGPVRYPELTAEPIPPSYPAAGQLAEIAAERMAAGAPVSPAEPLYLRRPDARVPGKPKRVTPS
jgi:tRNA threonylcarbamoyl adenosine modification protein YeaZ